MRNYASLLKTRELAQYHAFEDEENRIRIARKFIEAKFDKSIAVMDHLKQRYPAIDYDFSEDIGKLRSASTIKENKRSR